MSSLETQILEFSLKLFKKLSNNQNLVVSPLSVSTCLSMALMGTRSSSATELSNCLFGKTVADNEYDSLAKELQELSDKCVKTNENALNCSNLMYTQSEFPVLQSFQQLLQNYFSTINKTLDFKSKVSVDVINGDIKSATKGKIDKILDTIDDRTVVLLVNALYFKGLWSLKFDKEMTQTDVFTTSGNREINVEMMYQNKKYPFGYSHQLKCRAVELSYENSNAVMIVLLPDEGHSLAQLRDQLTIQSLVDLVERMHTIEVDLYLPRFKVESTLELIPPLSDLGVKAVFDPNIADFSGLSDRPGVCVSKVIQKAVIEVTEEGTEAAAATLIGFVTMSMPIRETFKANRPFMYLLVTKNDRKPNSIVFMGECYNPNQ